jgi:DNA polymerase III psi subunit
MANTIYETIYQEELYHIEVPAVVILNKQWNELTSEEKEQLQKIADALTKRINPKLRLDAFQVIQQAKFDLGSIQPSPKRVIYFGSAVTGLNAYELIEVNTTKVVLSESLDDLLKNEVARQKLWKALQQLFT